MTKRYGSIKAVDSLTFELQPGTVTGFLGPNGAGKSTTLRILLGLSKPTAGTALIDGRAYAELEKPARMVGALLESGDFHPGRSGRNHLRALAVAMGVPMERVEEVLTLVGLGRAAHRPAGTYSLGMRQRLGLAGALLGGPRVLILDEPANGLDPAGVRWMRDLLRQFAEDGGTVLVSSHVLAEIVQVVDRALIIDGGRLIADVGRDELGGKAAVLEDLYLQATSKEAS